MLNDREYYRYRRAYWKHKRKQREQENSSIRFISPLRLTENGLWL